MTLITFQIENSIDEWADGTRANIPFTQDAYEDLFNEHLEELNKFDEFTKALKILPALLWEIHDEGRCAIKPFSNNIKCLIFSS